MKKIKTINKLLSSIMLFNLITGIGFSSYQQQKHVITQNTDNSLSKKIIHTNYTNEERQMGDIVVTVEEINSFKQITGYVSGKGILKVDPDIKEIKSLAFLNNSNIVILDLSIAENLRIINSLAFRNCTSLTKIITKRINPTMASYSSNYYLTVIGAAAFWGCENLSGDLDLIFNNKDKYSDKEYGIDFRAFERTNISHVNLTVLHEQVYHNPEFTIQQNAFVSLSNNFTVNLFLDMHVLNYIFGSISSSRYPCFVCDPAKYDVPNKIEINFNCNDCLIGRISFDSFLKSYGLLSAYDSLLIPSYSARICVGDSETSRHLIDSRVNKLYFSDVDNGMGSFYPKFGIDWIYTDWVTNVYVPQGKKNNFLSLENFLIDSSKVNEWTINPSSFNMTGGISEINISSNSVGRLEDQPFSVSGCFPETLSNDAFNWNLSETAPEGLTVEKGKIRYSHVPKGNYSFTVIANDSQLVLSDKHTCTSGTIKLNSYDTLIDGEKNISAKISNAGSNQYTFSSDPTGITPDQWEIEMTEGQKPEWLSIDNNGLLSWTDQCTTGVYKFKIKAIDSNHLLTSESDEISLTVYSDQVSVAGKTEIKGLSSSAGSEQYTLNSTPEGLMADRWEIEMTEGVKPDWLSIDNNGLLSWTENSIENIYKFKVRAINTTLNVQSEIDVTLTLYSLKGEVRGEEQIEALCSNSGSQQYTFSSTPEGLVADQWEIEMTEGQKPEWLSIDNNGLLSWTDQCVEGTYKFKIVGTNNEYNIKGELNIELKLYSSLVNIAGDTEIYSSITLSGSEQYSFVSSPEGLVADQWEIEMTEGVKPDWLSIDNNGLLSWTDQCTAGVYKFKVKGVNTLFNIQSEKAVTLTINKHVVVINGDENLTGKSKKYGSQQYTFSSTPEGLVADQWEIEMTEGEKPEWLSIDNNGLLSWTDQCVEGIYKFKIKATNLENSTTAKTNQITLTITKQESKKLWPLILGLLIGLGIPVILAIAFIIWYFTKKKKITVKI